MIMKGKAALNPGYAMQGDPRFRFALSGLRHSRAPVMPQGSNDASQSSSEPSLTSANSGVEK